MTMFLFKFLELGGQVVPDEILELMFPDLHGPMLQKTVWAFQHNLQIASGESSGLEDLRR
jgi:hypothetical protein